ncbi:nitrate- and nitrite sensing domain-containing protein [Nonomuraea dietziae]|uniref:sensor histidine kinase n=1 Tax=Nonomuraea dietziae TaxID=65515 RepID=UPI0033E4423E
MTAGESLELRSYKERWTNLRQPATKLIGELQRERLSSASLVVNRATADEQAEAYTQRARTDTARERFRQLSELSRGSSTPAVRTEIDTVLTQLAHLEGIRGEIDAGLSPILPTIEAYNAISDALFGLQRSVALIDDLPIYEQSRLVINLGYAKELLTREQAIAVGDPGEEERKLFTQLVGNRRFLIDQALAELDAPLREIQVGIITSPPYQRLRIMEEQIIAGHAPADWPTASDALATTIQEAQNSASILLSERAEPVADAVLVRALVLAGTGLVVVVVSIVISLRMGNRLSRELGTLRQAALEVAESRLPQVVLKLRQGEEVEVPALTVPGRTAEIQDVGKAFATVQQTAVEAAVGEAKLRAGVGQVFRNLARRSQTLLHRQRIQLDGMQRTATDPQALDDLFRLDHLTTRMRRHAEGLIILSGAVPGRGWRKPVPLHDVVRGASAEVEDYTRVSVSPMPDHSLAGPVVGDVIHLIAELIENATVFSPPHTAVTVRGELAAHGFAIEVEDRGLGLSEEELADLNERLANPPEFDLADSDRLGLFVVARLAARHDIRVTLRGSPYGGTTAIVLIPGELVSERTTSEEESDAPQEHDPEPARRMRVVTSD